MDCLLTHPGSAARGALIHRRRLPGRPPSATRPPARSPPAAGRAARPGRLPGPVPARVQPGQDGTWPIPPASSRPWWSLASTPAARPSTRSTTRSSTPGTVPPEASPRRARPAHRARPGRGAALPRARRRRHARPAGPRRAVAAGVPGIGRARHPARAPAPGTNTGRRRAPAGRQPAAPRPLPGGPAPGPLPASTPMGWTRYAGGPARLGHDGAGFAFDNERLGHDALPTPGPPGRPAGHPGRVPGIHARRRLPPARAVAGAGLGDRPAGRLEGSALLGRPKRTGRSTPCAACSRWTRTRPSSTSAVRGRAPAARWARVRLPREAGWERAARSRDARRRRRAS